MNEPLFSVVLPTRNRLEKLRRALLSLQRQTLADYELLVVDDGSTDGTADFLASALQSDGIPGMHRPVVIRNAPSRGAGAARNQAIGKARGQLIAFLDDDDQWYPDYLENQSRRIADHSHCGASCAVHIEHDEEGRLHVPDLEPLFDYDDELVYLLTESFVHTMSVLVVRREAIAKVGLLDESLRVTHDWDWCARLLRAGYSILPPRGPAVVDRQIPGGLVSQLQKWYEEEQVILARMFGSEPRARPHRRRIQAYRNLLFARLALSRGEVGFGIRRLLTSVMFAPWYSTRLALMKLNRARLCRENPD